MILNQPRRFRGCAESQFGQCLKVNQVCENYNIVRLCHIKAAKYTETKKDERDSVNCMQYNQS